MFSYYTSLALLSWISLGTLCLLVHENARIPHGDKQLFYLTYALIAVSLLAEFCGMMLNGREGFSGKALLLVKTLDYIVTPMAGGAMIFQMKLRNRWNMFIIGLLAFNTLFQLFCTMGGWMVRVDENNRYHHGPLYPVYLALCLVIIGVVVLQFVLYGRSFRRQNRKSMYAIMLLVVAGIALQEFSGGENRTAYVGLTVGAAMLFIHYAEFGSQEIDDNLRTKQRQLDTDTLTGVYSRYAYSHVLKELDAQDALPGKFAAFTVDINGLKQVNDELGHEAGDELICGAAACIKTALCWDGRCYRTGGDEFVVLARMDREDAEAAILNLQWEADHWQGEIVQKLSLAAGFALAAEHEGLSAEKLVGESDKAMYEAKARHYRQAGMDRRKRAAEAVE